MTNRLLKIKAQFLREPFCNKSSLVPCYVSIDMPFNICLRYVSCLCSIFSPISSSSCLWFLRYVGCSFVIVYAQSLSTNDLLLCLTARAFQHCCISVYTLFLLSITDLSRQLSASHHFLLLMRSVLLLYSFHYLIFLVVVSLHFSIISNPVKELSFLLSKPSKELSFFISKPEKEFNFLHFKVRQRAEFPCPDGQPKWLFSFIFFCILFLYMTYNIFKSDTSNFNT